MAEKTKKVTFHLMDEVNEKNIWDSRPTTIYYAAKTCWWTHDPDDLHDKDGIRFAEAPDHKGVPGHRGIPMDPRESPLFETDEVKEFMEQAVAHPDHYGKHGLDAFWLSHAANLRIKLDGRIRQWAFSGWQEYNDLLDKAGDKPWIEEEIE